MDRSTVLDLETQYWPRYCEENVWHLCGALPVEIARAHVLLISNAHRGVAMWSQRATGSRTQPVVWDYHVVLLGLLDDLWQIWDADYGRPSPELAERYLDASFLPLPDEYAGLRPRFRIVEADVYRRTLCSDRHHMQAPDGSWLSPPPPTAPIGSGSNLMRLIDTQADFVGRVCNLRSLREWLSTRCAAMPT